MPHDNKGQELSVGDLVMVPCRVKVIQLTEDYCNVTLEVRVNMWPSDTPTSLTLNSRQVLKSDATSAEGILERPR